jgi:hypothetical protein
VHQRRPVWLLPGLPPHRCLKTSQDFLRTHRAYHTAICLLKVPLSRPSRGLCRLKTAETLCLVAGA